MGKKGATPRKGRTCAWPHCKRTGVVQVFTAIDEKFYCKEHGAQIKVRGFRWGRK